MLGAWVLCLLLFRTWMVGASVFGTWLLLCLLCCLWVLSCSEIWMHSLWVCAPWMVHALTCSWLLLCRTILGPWISACQTFAARNKCMNIWVFEQMLLGIRTLETWNLDMLALECLWLGCAKCCHMVQGLVAIPCSNNSLVFVGCPFGHPVAPSGPLWGDLVLSFKVHEYMGV